MARARTSAITERMTPLLSRRASPGARCEPAGRGVARETPVETGCGLARRVSAILAEPPHPPPGGWSTAEKTPMVPIALEVDRAAAEKVREHEIEEARTLQRAMVPAAPLQAYPVEIANQFRPVT